jgi:predicted metalloprotease
VLRLLPLFAALACAAPAAAAPLERAGSTASIATSDPGGARVAYALPGQRRVAIVSGSSRRLVRHPRRCELMALRGPRLHFVCGDSEERVTSAADGRTLRLPGVTALNRRVAACEADPDCSASVTLRGTDWIGVEWRRHDENPTLVTLDFTNVATGEVRARSESATAVDDPSYAGLARPLCPPLRRTPTPDRKPFDPPFRSFAYARPWAVAAFADRFELRRCGRARPVLALDRAVALSLTPRHLAWMTADPGPARQRLHVRNLATGRRASWRVDRFLGVLTIPAFTLTRDALYLLDFARPRAGRLPLYRARLP